MSEATAGNRPNASRVPDVVTKARASWVELLMAVLAVATILLAVVPETPLIARAIFVIWISFVLEYFYRLFRAPQKWRFMRQNLPDLIALVPDGPFRAARLLRLVRLLRLLRGMEVLWRVSRHFRGIMRTNHLGETLTATAAVVLFGGLLVWTVDRETVATFADGLWWSLTTVTTVGSDVHPTSGLSKFIAAFLLLIGIGMIGMITGSITTYFLGLSGTRNPDVRHVQKRLDEWDRMTSAEKRHVAGMLTGIVQEEERHVFGAVGEGRHDAS